MRNLSLVLMALSIGLLMSVTAQASSNPTYLSIDVHDGDIQSVRTVKVLDDNYYIGVYGSKEFQIEPLSSYPLPADQIYVATSEGKLLEPEDERFPYQCDYLIKYWGMVIAVYPDGYIESFPFEIGPAWRKGEEIIEEFPEISMPRTEDARVDALILDWWSKTVEPADREWRDKFFGNSV